MVFGAEAGGPQATFHHCLAFKRHSLLSLQQGIIGRELGGEESTLRHGSYEGISFALLFEKDNLIASIIN